MGHILCILSLYNNLSWIQVGYKQMRLFKSRRTQMEVHEEQRKNVPDRRVKDTAVFPLQDQDETWVVTERRKGGGRRSGLDDAMVVQTGLITPILLGSVLILAGFWILIRSGIINEPSWLPIWILYPEILIGHLL